MTTKNETVAATVAFNEQQRRVIDSRGKNILVSASAGSGKTTVMIERIVRLLSEGHSLDRMAVCTFTNAAADDMRRKLTESLSMRSDDPHMREQLALLPQAQICTLHKWCAALIRTYFYACDLDPDFEIADDSERNAMLTDAIESAIGEYVAAGDGYFAVMYDVLKTKRTHRRLSKMIRELYEYAYVRCDPEQWLSRAESAAGDHEAYVQDAKARCDRTAAAMARQAQRLKRRMNEAGFHGDDEAIDAFCVAASGGDAEIKIRALSSDSEYCDLHNEFKKLKSDYIKLSGERAAKDDLPNARDTARYVRLLCGITRRAAQLYGEQKRRRGFADYDDLEHEAYKILCAPDAAEEVMRRYETVFVDEYQDINPLQEALLGKLQSRMFFVGDVKQSVYSFRMCDPKFFMQKAARYAGESGAGESEGGELMRLTRNYRSDSRILDAADKLFSRVMTESTGGADYAQTSAFDAQPRYKSDEPIRVTLLCREQQTETPETGIYSVSEHHRYGMTEPPDREADAVTAHIMSLIADKAFDKDGNAVDIGDAGEGCRPVGFGDIAVLVRSRKGFARRLMRRLAEFDIPATFEGDDAGGTRVISLLNSYLRIVDNYCDDISLAAALLCEPIGGMTDGDLSLIRQAYPDGYFFDAVTAFAQRADDCPENERATAVKAAEFLQTLNGFRSKKGAVRADVLAGEITAKFGLFAYALHRYGAEEAAALDSFLAQMATLSYGVTLYDWLSFCDRCGLPAVEHAAADAGAVRVMTVHASKGLEFPFVILPQLHKEFNVSDLNGQMLLSDDEGVTLKYWDTDEHVSKATAQFEYVREQKRLAAVSEEMRVLYVAMTRARCQLAMFAQPKKEPCVDSPSDAKSFLDWLYPDICDLSVPPDELLLEPKRNIIITKPSAELCAELQARLDFLPTADALPGKTTVTRESAADDGEATVYAAGGEHDDRAAKRGTAYHKFMQCVNFDAPFGDEWERLAGVSGIGELCDQDELKAACGNVREYTRGMTLMREQPFVLRRGSTLVQGVIDLLAVDDCGQAHVVDYKTTRAEGLTSESYRAQMDYYCAAVTEIMGLKVARRALYSFSMAKFVPV